MLHVSLIFHTENSTHNPSFLLYIQKYHTLCNLSSPARSTRGTRHVARKNPESEAIHRADKRVAKNLDPEQFSQ